MSVQTSQWEHKLVSLAIAALESNDPVDQNFSKDSQALDRAYEHCEDITRFHSKTFYMASNLLPKAKRKAVRALYAFCRVSDDLIDETENHSISELENWKSLCLDVSKHFHIQNDSSEMNQVKEKHASTSFNKEMVALAWRDSSRKYNIPPLYAEQLIEGVRLDLQRKRYFSFEELVIYCYGVACTVGLMSMHIIGFKSQEALPYAIRLGVALQLTNILRDIAEDWRAGRLYLPQQELAEFGIDETYIADGIVDTKWRAFMRYQISRTRNLYKEANPGIKMLDRQGRFAIAAAARLYEGILDDIEKNNYQVFTRRASVSTFKKLRMLPGIWWQSLT